MLNLEDLEKKYDVNIFQNIRDVSREYVEGTVAVTIVVCKSEHKDTCPEYMNANCLNDTSVVAKLKFVYPDIMATVVNLEPAEGIYLENIEKCSAGTKDDSYKGIGADLLCYIINENRKNLKFIRLMARAGHGDHFQSTPEALKRLVDFYKNLGFVEDDTDANKLQKETLGLGITMTGYLKDLCIRKKRKPDEDDSHIPKKQRRS